MLRVTLDTETFDLALNRAIARAQARRMEALERDFLETAQDGPGAAPVLGSPGVAHGQPSPPSERPDAQDATPAAPPQPGG